MTALQLTRKQILAYRRAVGALDVRLPPGRRSLRRAAWAGLQDSMPRAALLSLHARVEATVADAWEHPSFVQLWGPRFSVFVVAVDDVAVFSLGRLGDGAKAAVGRDLADRLHDLLDGERMPFARAARALGEHHNQLRYAAPTGRVLLRWDGARQPEIWTVPAPDVDPARARLELARRYLHIYGPSTPATFARWAGVGRKHSHATFDALERAGELVAVDTPIGAAWLLAADEPAMGAAAQSSDPAAPARLLPSGDAYYLLHGTDRDLLVPDPARRDLLWTSRVWPGALLVDGEVAGTWRRAGAAVTVHAWQRLSAKARAAVEAEAASLPLPGIDGPVSVRWED